MAKIEHVQEDGKIRSNFFSADSYALKYLLFKFGNDISIAFEMPRSFFLMENQPFIANPSIYIRGPCEATKQYKFGVS